MKSVICCGVDFSNASSLAVEEAGRLARCFGGEVHLVHAYGVPAAALPLEGVALAGAAQAAELSTEAQRRLNAIAAEHPGVQVRTHLVVGDAATETLRVAKELKATYLVIGTHGRTGLSHLLLGSVAEKILRGATMPVVVVRSTEP